MWLPVGAAVAGVLLLLVVLGLAARQIRGVEEAAGVSLDDVKDDGKDGKSAGQGKGEEDEGNNGEQLRSEDNAVFEGCATPRGNQATGYAAVEVASNTPPDTPHVEMGLLGSGDSGSRSGRGAGAGARAEMAANMVGDMGNNVLGVENEEQDEEDLDEMEAELRDMMREQADQGADDFIEEPAMPLWGFRPSCHATMGTDLG